MGTALVVVVILAGAQTRPTPQSPQPQTRPTPAARATPLGRTAPAPLKIKMFAPGNFPPPHLLDSGSGGGSIPPSLSAVERQQIFSLTNGPLASLSEWHMLEPNKAGLRLVMPQYVGDGTILVWPKAADHKQSYICLDLYAEPNKTYFMDMAFESLTDVQWEVWGPDSKAEIDFPGGGRKVQHLTFGFTNDGKARKVLFTIDPNQESTMYRLDVYVR
jgi:hypothetical protein